MLERKWGKRRGVRKFLLALGRGRIRKQWKGVGMVLRIPGLGLPREVTFPRRAGGGEGCRSPLRSPHSGSRGSGNTRPARPGLM